MKFEKVENCEPQITVKLPQLKFRAITAFRLVTMRRPVALPPSGVIQFTTPCVRLGVEDLSLVILYPMLDELIETDFQRL